MTNGNDAPVVAWGFCCKMAKRRHRNEVLFVLKEDAPAIMTLDIGQSESLPRHSTIDAMNRKDEE